VTHKMTGGLSRPDTKARMLQNTLLDFLREHEQAGLLPTSLRFLFYELVQAGVVSKKATGKRRADQDMIDAATQLRLSGLVPWDWLVDETRQVREWDYGATVADYLADAASYARIDCWDGQPPPLLLCESRTFGGVLLRTLAPEYLAPVASTNGQVGGFLHTDVGPLLARGGAVLYIGDNDLGGGQIERNTRRVLEADLGPLDWTRVALTDEQVETFGLVPQQKVDGRFGGDRGVHEAVEVESLGQGVVTGIVRDALDAVLPEPLEGVRVRERRERDEWQARLRDGRNG
jgi:hypothetical protein